MQFFLKLLLLFSVIIIELHSQDVQKLRNRIDTLLSGTGILVKTTAALDIYDLTSQEPLYSLNNKMLLHPASNMKLLTSAAGIIFLKDYSYETSLLYTGEIVNGRLLGDLYIRGGCDPAFIYSDIDTLIKYLKLLNINHITGKVYADVSFKDNFFWGNGWMWDDDPSEDAAYLSALNINYNLVSVIIKPGAEGAVRTEPESSFFIVNNLTTASQRDSIYVTRDWQNRNNVISVTGTLDTFNTSERIKRINVYDPAAYFLQLFSERLNEHLIIYEGASGFRTSPAYANNICTVRRPFVSTLALINKASNNLSAEMVIYALAEKYYGRPATARNGLLLVDSLLSLAGLASADYKIVDGSGLSHYNLVTPEILLTLLKYMYFQRPDDFPKFYNSLSIAGKDGTLRNRMKGTNAEGKVHAKTGTLSGVSCLSGYVSSLSGRQLAFSIMIQNFTNDPVYARYVQDEICKILSEY